MNIYVTLAQMFTEEVMCFIQLILEVASVKHMECTITLSKCGFLWIYTLMENVG